MYYHPRRSLGNEDRVFKQRQYENALRDKINFVHKYENLMRYAQFEKSNEPKTNYRNLSEKLEAIRAHREQVLNERRRRLSALLGNEEEAINHEIRTGKMNLAERRAWLKAQALSESVEKHKAAEVHVGTSLEKALHESADEVAMHNSRLAIMKIEAEKKKQNENMGNPWHHKDLDLSHSLECEEHHTGPSDEHAVDILRRHLHMVDQLREEEKMAVEEDLICMNRRWLEEEEDLRRQQVEQRHHHSLHVREMLEVSEGKKGREEEEDAHIAAIMAEREGEEEHQLEELKESHRREAKAYVSQLKTAVARQRFEDEELEALIKAEMEQPCHSEPGFTGISSQGAEEDERMSRDDNKLSKRDLVDALEGQMRGLRAADLIDQETKRLAQEQSQGKKDKHPAADTRKRQTLAGLPHPEPYFGRRAVKWYE